MVAERNPIPDRPGYNTRAMVSTQCDGCGSRQERYNAQRILCCAYCGGSKGQNRSMQARPVVPQPRPQRR